MFRDKKFASLVIFILILAAILRLRGFDSHFLLASDSARDILVARGAVASGKIPWVGSFSSAGAFVFGPNWYWFLMIPAALAPSFFLGPWVAMFCVSLIIVILMIYSGKMVGGKKLGLIMGLVTSFSPATIGLSSYLTQHAMVAVFSALTLLGFVGFLKSHKIRYVFIISLGIGGGLSMHYQSLYLFAYYPLLAVFVIKYRVNILKAICLSAAGLLAFMWPLIFWDAQRSFKNTDQLIYYFREGQYRFWTSNRWLFYLRDFIPDQVGKLFGGGVVLGRILTVFVPVVILVQFFRKKLDKYIFSTSLVLLIQLVGVRYQRGEKYDGYLIFLHPLILFLTAWAIWQVLKISRLGLFISLMALLTCGIYFATPLLDWQNDVVNLQTTIKDYKEKFPSQKIKLYAHSLEAMNCSYSLSAIIESNKLSSEMGKPVGVCLYAPDNCFYKETPPEISRAVFQNDTCVLVDLSDVSKDKYKTQGNWYPMNVEAVHDDVQGWWQK